MSTLRRNLGLALLIPAVAVLVAPASLAQRRETPSERPKPAARQAALSIKTPERITAQQIDNTEARIAAALQLVNRLEPEAKRRGLASGWRQSALETLLPLSLEGLREVEQRAFDLDSLTSAVAEAADDPNAIGEVDKDLVYIPIAPCRFIDTRNAGGKINGTRGFDMDVSGATYGGSAACNLAALFGTGFAAFGALAINVTIVDTSTSGGVGFLAVKPTSAAPTTSLLNWYDIGPAVQVANQGIVSVDQDLVTPNEFVIQTSGEVHVIVDVFGGFITPQATALQRIETNAFVLVPANGSAAVTSPQCPATYTLTGGGCFTQHNNHVIETSWPITDRRWECWGRNNTGGDSRLDVWAVCARVPGRP